MDIFETRRKQVAALNISYDAKIFKIKPISDMWIQDEMGKDVLFVKEGCIFLFIDQNPSANWSHPCIYAYIDLDTDVLYSVTHNWPPKEGYLLEEV